MREVKEMSKEKKFSGYFVILGASLVLFVHNGVMGTLGLFIPEFAEGLSESIANVSMGLTISSIVAFLISLFVGRLIVRFSPKYMLLAGTITCSIQCLIYGSATSIWILYCGAIVEGITTGIATTTCISAVAKQWFIAKRASVIGYVIGGAMLGSALFNTITGLFIAGLGWRYAYYALAATALIIAVPANLILIRKSPEKVGQKPLGWEREAELEAELALETGGLGLTLSEVRKTAPFWLVLIFGGLFAGLSMGFITFAPTFWQDNGMDPLKSSFYFTLFSLLAVVATMAAGKLADKLGNKIFIIYLHVAFIIGIITAIMSGDNMSATLIVLSIIGASIGFACYTTMLPTITTELFGSREFEKITGMFMAANYIGLCLVSPVCGTIRDVTGSFVPAFALLAVMALLSMAAILIALQAAPMKKLLRKNV